MHQFLCCHSQLLGLERQHDRKAFPLQETVSQGMPRNRAPKIPSISTSLQTKENTRVSLALQQEVQGKIIYGLVASPSLATEVKNLRVA